MKIQIEISDDLALDDETTSYCVRAERNYPYFDRDNYLCERRGDPEILRADTLKELYERIGEEVVSHLLYGEQEKKSRSGRIIAEENYTVTFSDIFVEAYRYDHEQMRASTKFQEIGLAREQARQQQEERDRAECDRVARWNAAQKEKQDAAEYQRLRAKYEKHS